VFEMDVIQKVDAQKIIMSITEILIYMCLSHPLRDISI
jgi:hypothetical protein